MYMPLNLGVHCLMLIHQRGHLAVISRRQWDGRLIGLPPLSIKQIKPFIVLVNRLLMTEDERLCAKRINNNNSQRAAKLHGQLRKFEQNLSAKDIITQFTGKGFYLFYIPSINFEVTRAFL